MASQRANHWVTGLGTLLGVVFLTNACSSVPQGMTPYQQGQLQLQQQQLQLQQQQQAADAYNQRQAHFAQMTDAVGRMLNSTPDYSGGGNQTQCVTGTDAMGRLVTQCQ